MLKLDASNKGAEGGVVSHKSIDKAPVQIVTPRAWAKAGTQLSSMLKTLD